MIGPIGSLLGYSQVKIKASTENVFPSLFSDQIFNILTHDKKRY